MAFKSCIYTIHTSSILEVYVSLLNLRNKEKLKLNIFGLIQFLKNLKIL